MKPKHIKNKTAKRLKRGYHTDLMDLIEESIDLYNEETFSRGHDSFFEDASVHSHRLAELIMRRFSFRTPTEPFNLTTVAKVIEDYFNSLKTE